MKKILIIIISGILFFSCSDDDAASNAESAKEFALSKETVNLANIEGSGTISVTSGGSWTAR